MAGSWPRSRSPWPAPRCCGSGTRSKLQGEWLLAMRSARVGCLCLAALVPSTSHADALPRLGPGAGMDVPVVVRLKSPPSFVLAEPADLVLEWETGTASSVTLPGGITTPCASSPCVLPVAQPGAYRIEPDKDAPMKVRLRALALPKAPLLVLGSKVDLEPARAAADDPRGKSPTRGFTSTPQGRVILDLSPMTTAAHYRPGNAVRPREARRPWSGRHADDPDEHLDGGARRRPDVVRCRARRLSSARERHQGQRAARPLAPTVNKVQAQAQAATPASAPRLAVGATLDIDLPRATPPQRTALSIPGGFDLAIEWTPSDVELGLDRTNEERLCERSPCIVSRASAGIVAISAFPTDAPREVKVHARLLPQVKPQGPFAVGKASNIETRLPSADDPRGAMAEVVCDVRAPGSYEVTAQDLGWVPTNAAAATRGPLEAGRGHADEAGVGRRLHHAHRRQGSRGRHRPRALRARQARACSCASTVMAMLRRASSASPVSSASSRYFATAFFFAARALAPARAWRWYRLVAATRTCRSFGRACVVLRDRVGGERRTFATVAR